MDYKRQDNCIYHCVYHLILVTKYRRKIFNDGVFAYMREALKKFHEFYPEIEIKEIRHDRDHIHLMLWIPPTFSIGKVVTILKSHHSRPVNPDVH